MLCRLMIYYAWFLSKGLKIKIDETLEKLHGALYITHLQRYGQIQQTTNSWYWSYFFSGK